VVRDSLEHAYPRLTTGSYRVTSPADRSYNCVAWAAEDTTRWWWPDPMQVHYWPERVRRSATLAAFVEAFSLLGYTICATPDYERGYEKVAIYSLGDGSLTHVARQLRKGKWTSKLGSSVDIRHDTLERLHGEAYGEAVHFLKRQRVNRLRKMLHDFGRFLQRITCRRVLVPDR
jgi:hypothetical protein